MRRDLFDAMTAALGAGWAHVPGLGFRIRWTEELPLPAHMRDHPIYGVVAWGDTYERHVFLGLPTVHSMPLARVDRAPWIDAQDFGVSLAAARELLANPCRTVV
jgi:hypothetical protein